MTKLITDYKKYLPYITLAFCLLFYLFFSLKDGYVWCADTNTYVSMSIAREPLYPLYLALFRKIIGDGETYLLLAVTGQGLLLGAAIWSLTTYIHRLIKIPALVYISTIICSLGVSLLCRFAARRGSMYSNSLLSEGLAIPLFLFFFRFLYEYAVTKNRKSLIISLVLSFLLISTRKQMFVSLFLIAVVFFVHRIREKKIISGLLMTVALSAAVICSTVLFDCTANYFVHGSFVRHANDNRFILTMVFYEADRQDGELIEDKEIRDLFYKIYDTCEENGFFIGKSGKDWYERSTLFADHYDNIQLDTMYPMIQDFVEQKNREGINVNLGIDDVSSQMMKPILPRVTGKIIITALDNVMNGLTTTVAVKNRMLLPYVYIIIPAYLALMIYLRKTDGHSSIVILAELIMLSIISNVGIVAMVIFSQSRYTIYNMPLFYIGFILMLYRLHQKKVPVH